MVGVILAQDLLHYRVCVTHFVIALVLEVYIVHSLADAALLELHFQPLSKSLLPVYSRDSHRCVISGLIADESVSFAASARLISHDAHTQDNAAVLLTEEVEEVEI